MKNKCFGLLFFLVRKDFLVCCSVVLTNFPSRPMGFEGSLLDVI